MEINKRILYIGNNLSSNTKYTTTMDTLSSLLMKENYSIIKSSNKLNKVLRLLDMCMSVIRNSKKIDYILIDTFSTSNFYYAFLTSQLARFFKIKYIPILHGGNLPSRLDRSKNLSNLIFKNSYLNIAPSNYLKNEFSKRGFETKFVPNILEIEKYKFKKREKLKPTIIWVRAFKELYNPTMAIDVLYLLKKEFSEVKLCMVGPIKDESFEKAKEQAKKYNLLESIEFTGVLPKEIWHKLSENYDMLINTTNFDNTPVSVMEAMALGLTVISTNAGGMPYLIDHKVDGILVEKSDSKKMAKEIIDLLQSNNNKLAVKARRKAEAFGWEAVKPQWNSILNN